MNKDMVKLAVDLAKGKVTQYSTEQGNEVLRKAFAELMEFSLEGDGKIDRKTFRKHKAEIFELLEVIINETLEEGLRNQFDGFAEYRNLAWGDQNVFYTPSNDIFRVAMVSDGNGNIRRQRLRDGQEFSVGLDTYAIKIGEEFHRFLAGRIQWADLTNKIAESFRRDLTKRIYKAVYDSYGKYNSTYHNTFTAASFTEDQLVELAMHVQARTGEQVAVYGTKLALRKLAPSKVTEALANQRNMTGFYGEIAGIQLREIEQSHEYGTDTFAIDNNFLLVLPQNADRMVKVINEGDAVIQDQAGGVSSDMMQEYFIAQKFGVAVICSKAFGYIRLI